MGNTLPEPRKEKHLEEGEFGTAFTYGVADMQGWRTNMEDAYTVAPNFSADYDETHFVGIFDGHGGSEVAKFCAAHFHEQLKNLDSFQKSKFSAAIKECFHIMDEMLQRPEHFAEVIDHRAEAIQHQFKVISEIIIAKKHNNFSLNQLHEVLNLANYCKVSLTITPELVKALEALSAESAAEKPVEKVKEPVKVDANNAPVAPLRPQKPEQIKKGIESPKKQLRPFSGEDIFGGESNPRGTPFFIDNKESSIPPGLDHKKKSSPFLPLDNKKKSSPFLPNLDNIEPDRPDRLSKNLVKDVFMSDDEDEVIDKGEKIEATSVMEIRNSKEDIMLPTPDNLLKLRRSMNMNRSSGENLVPIGPNADDWSDEDPRQPVPRWDPKKKRKKPKKSRNRRKSHSGRSRSGTIQSIESAPGDDDEAETNAQKMKAVIQSNKKTAASKKFKPRGYRPKKSVNEGRGSRVDEKQSKRKQGPKPPSLAPPGRATNSELSPSRLKRSDGPKPPGLKKIDRKSPDFKKIILKPIEPGSSSTNPIKSSLTENNESTKSEVNLEIEENKPKSKGEPKPEKTPESKIEEKSDGQTETKPSIKSKKDVNNTKLAVEKKMKELQTIQKRNSFYENVTEEYTNLEKKVEPEKRKKKPDTPKSELNPYKDRKSKRESAPDTSPVQDAATPVQSPAQTEEPKFITEAGCTAVSALFKKDKIYVANVGDSRAVMSRSGTARGLSEDHKPSLPKERARIYKAGGSINAEGRINGDLNLSRCVGDLRFKMQKHLKPSEQIITAEPDVREFTMTKQDQFVVFACDGVWDVKSNQDVVSFILNKIKSGEESLSKIAGQLLDSCIAKDLVKTKGLGGDNMTCIIIALQPLSEIKQFKKNNKKNTVRMFFKDAADELDL